VPSSPFCAGPSRSRRSKGSFGPAPGRVHHSPSRSATCSRSRVRAHLRTSLALRDTGRPLRHRFVDLSRSRRSSRRHRRLRQPGCRRWSTRSLCRAYSRRCGSACRADRRPRIRARTNLEAKKQGAAAIARLGALRDRRRACRLACSGRRRAVAAGRSRSARPVGSSPAASCWRLGTPRRLPQLRSPAMATAMPAPGQFGSSLTSRNHRARGAPHR